MAEEAFFVQRGDAYDPTELTRGPWDPDSQHAGPPAALIGREIERLEDHGNRQVGRITFEILRPVPIAPLRVQARVVRPGRSVELVEASLSDSDGEVIRATAWRLRLTEIELPAGLTSGDGPGLIGTSPSTLRPGFAPPGAEEARPGIFPPTGHDVGYHTAMEYRFVQGDFGVLGPALVWMRMRQPLIAGEEPSPLERVLVAADSGNGVSATLEWGRYLFINVDLTVHLHRPLAGEWVCLDSVTIPEPDGIGLADTALYDGRGPIGRAAQTLLIDERRM
ncbi:MAG TPA: thioesterase family protein [Solirubrobacterales bacterium]|nr:thioesterase family protein [Solirubrobacterales bacterium]